MMIEQDFTLPKNARVRIKGEVTGPEAGLYEYAVAGGPGWVRGQRKDRWGYPMIRIEWDKEHWSYNGEEDMWTFESHFDLVEEAETMAEPEKSQKDIMRETLEAFLNERFPEDEANKTEASDTVNPEHLRYEAVLEEAWDDAKQADGVFIITVHSAEDPQHGPILAPAVHEYYLTPEARLLAEAQIGQISQKAHATMAFERIRELMNNSSN